MILDLPGLLIFTVTIGNFQMHERYFILSKSVSFDISSFSFVVKFLHEHLKKFGKNSFLQSSSVQFMRTFRLSVINQLIHIL